MKAFKSSKKDYNLLNNNVNNTNRLTCLGNVNIYSHQGFKCPIKTSQPFESLCDCVITS